MGRPRKTYTRGSGTRAVVYLRVSKEDGTSKQGLPVQSEACQRYLERQAYTLVDECVDDGVSGAKPWRERDELARAVQLCLDRQADLIVAYHQDRFARKMGVFEDLRDVAMLKGFRLETADGRVLTRAEDLVVGDALSFVAALERRRISERFQAARRHRSLDDGMGSGTVPWGYVLVSKGQIVVDEAAAETIWLLFRLRRRHTYQATADELNAKGVLSPRGKPWTTSQVQGIERHEQLYRTGVRTWDGVTAAVAWPVIL